MRHPSFRPRLTRLIYESKNTQMQPPPDCLSVLPTEHKTLATWRDRAQRNGGGGVALLMNHECTRGENIGVDTLGAQAKSAVVQQDEKMTICQGNHFLDGCVPGVHAERHCTRAGLHVPQTNHSIRIAPGSQATGSGHPYHAIQGDFGSQDGCILVFCRRFPPGRRHFDVLDCRPSSWLAVAVDKNTDVLRCVLQTNRNRVNTSKTITKQQKR